MEELKILKEVYSYKDGKFEYISDEVVLEVSLTILINGIRLTGIACLPEHLPQLALGFLWSEGLVQNREEIKGVEFDEDNTEINFLLDIPSKRIDNFWQTGEKTSGCGSGLSTVLAQASSEFSPLRIKAAGILDRMKEFQATSHLFRQTGGVHRAGIVQNDQICYAADDIGRHNAVDKVAGMAIEDGFDLKSSYLICSGRISSEIVKKAVRLRIPLIVSHSAATSEAIRLGWDYRVYLIGFARGRRFNLYSGIDRIEFE